MSDAGRRFDVAEEDQRVIASGRGVDRYPEVLHGEVAVFVVLEPHTVRRLFEHRLPAAFAEHLHVDAMTFVGPALGLEPRTYPARRYCEIPCAVSCSSAAKMTSSGCLMLKQDLP